MEWFFGVALMTFWGLEMGGGWKHDGSEALEGK